MDVSTYVGDDARMRKVERELRKLAPHNNGGVTDAPPQHKRRRNSTTKKEDGELAIENQYKLPYQCPQFHHPKADSNSANRGRIHSNALTMTDATGDMMPDIRMQRTKYLVESKCKRQQGFGVIVKTPKSTATVTSKRIYYSGTNGYPDGMPPDEDAVWKSAPETLHVLGRDDDAFRVIDDEGRFICSRPNRKSHSHKVFSKRSRHAMEAILSKSTTGNAKRSPKKQPENDLEEGTKYGCVGPSPNRGGRGIVSNVRKLCEKTRREINRILTQVEEVLSQTISPQQVHIQKKMIGKMELPGFERSETLTNIAVGCRVFLPVHTDEDAFYSATTVCDGDGKRRKGLAYFCFPTHGFCIELGHGDVLVFDAYNWEHCISSPAVEGDIYCTSFYVKSKLVGGNDNSKDLTKEQKEQLRNFVK